MTDALTLCGVFVLGLMVGGGIVGGVIGWYLSKEELVIETLTRFLLARPGLLDVLNVRVPLQAQADARLERALLEKTESMRSPP